MAFYIKKENNRKKQEEEKNSGNVAPEMRPFYKILGCVIALIVVMILWAVRG